MSPPRVAILDYGCGNLASVANAVRKVGGGEPYRASPGALGIHQASHIIMPGQGAFRDIAPWIEELNRANERGQPILGICLGMQLMCEGSEEAPGVKGLGWIPCTVKRLAAQRLPHIGWNEVSSHGDFYFCHSYGIPARDADEFQPSEIAFTGHEGKAFVSLWRDKNLWAVQFHPEKSGRAGLALLAEFLKL